MDSGLMLLPMDPAGDEVRGGVGTHLEADFYRRVIKVLPIVCVDVIVKRGQQILLVKRANEPLKGQWWVPGGRILKDETALNAVHRKVFDETGLSVSEVEFVGIYEESYETSAFGVSSHCISLVFEAHGHGVVKPNSEVTHWAWGFRLPDRFMEKLTWR